MSGQANLQALVDAKDTDAVVRFLQLVVKGGVPEVSPENEEVITVLTKSSDVATRFWAKKALGKLADSLPEPKITEETAPVTSTELLLQKLNAVESTFVSLDTIKLLCESKDPQVLQPLIDYLSRCTDEVQISYLTKQLGLNFPSDDLLPTLIPFLKHNDDRVVANTVEGIEAIGSPKSVALFAQLLDHPSNRVRTNASKALFRFDRETASQVLNRMLTMTDKPHFAISACHAVGFLKDEAFLPKLKELLREELLFQDSLSAIESIGSQTASKTLAEALAETQNTEQRELIRSVLSRLGYEAKTPNHEVIQPESPKGTPLPELQVAQKTVSVSTSNFGCPRCSQIDMVRTLKALIIADTVVSSSTTTGVAYSHGLSGALRGSSGLTIGVSGTVGQEVSAIALKLRPPPMRPPTLSIPSKAPEIAEGCFSMCTAPFVAILLTMFPGVSIPFIWNLSLGRTLNLSIVGLQVVGTIAGLIVKQFEWHPYPPLCAICFLKGIAVTVMLACLFVHFMIVLLGLVKPHLSKGSGNEAKAKELFKEKLAQYKISYHNAMKAWEETKYCSRCDVVFLDGDDLGACSDQLSGYLGFPPSVDYTVHSILQTSSQRTPTLMNTLTRHIHESRPS